MERKMTSVSRRHFSTTTDSWSFFKWEYSSSSFLFFHRARRFWNQTATCRGSSPSSDAKRSFLSDSNLCSLPKFVSKRWTCWAVSFLFFAAAAAASDSDDPLFFLRRRLGFDSPELPASVINYLIRFCQISWKTKWTGQNSKLTTTLYE